MSARLGLLTPNKYSAVVNIFGSSEETEAELKAMGAVDLNRYYERHNKKYKRMKLRMKILAEKKEKKIKALAEAQGVNPSEIDPESVYVSDVSDSELSGRGMTTSGSEAEDLVEMFQTDIERREEELFVNGASVDVDLNDFVPSSEMKYREDSITDQGYYSFYQSNVEVPIEVVEQNKLNFPETLKPFVFPRGNIDEFPHPRIKQGLKVFDYYCMDAASLLPVLALDVQPKDVVADFCSAPGGKALAMAISLRPSRLLCNELSPARMSRLKNVMKSHIPRMDAINEMIELREGDALNITEYNTYDRILLDVPCTNDRRSVNSDENNIFKPSRVKERVDLPQVQCRLLAHALKCVKPGGSLVYSTCSLSPIQNDGVVHMALKTIGEETNIKVQIVDLKEAVRPLRGIFKFHRHFKYGQQVIPFLPSNFGPMYFCKINRLE
jgi:16S rRNA C967 or C1407 C5-methylase (RsmB/RsmF family)